MLHKLRHTCACLWILGLAGMVTLRVLLGHDPAEFPFRLAAALWVLGGVGFTCFAGLGCFAHARPPRASAPARPRA